jgi:glycogen phosphorylase
VDAGSSPYLNLPERIAGLGELADNLWWSWHPEARQLFKVLNRQVWKESTHNPVRTLRDLGKEDLEGMVNDPEFLRLYDAVLAKFRREMAERQEVWFAQSCPVAHPYPIAYFSAEYGLHHSLPFYAGGLGFLAGDYMKECSDLGVPFLAVGFMYPEGYIHQHIRDDGWQENTDEVLDRDAASITRVLDEKGNQLVIQVPFMDPPIHVALWKVSVGRVPLYLMDTDIEANHPWNRAISLHLYTGDLEQRLRQEIVLGIGGSAVLQALNIKHSIMHLNEGHAAFALLERIRERVQTGMSYIEAVEKVRNTSVFTGHTPVPAGHDIFPFPMMEKYFRIYWPHLGLDHDRFLELGINPGEPYAGFNMTALALRLSAYRNGVSKRHGEVARQMWQGLWPDTREDQVPIDYVTNGVHVPTWIEPKVQLLFNRYLGHDWLDHHDDPAIWARIDEIPDTVLWQTHSWLKTKLINAIREAVRIEWVRERTSPTNVLAGGTLLDPSILTIGFARRFATYKRADLILSDMERLKGLLNDRWRPIQIVFAGKAHPADDAGKRLLQRVYNAARDCAMAGRIAFVQDYGEQLGQYMVHGVDVWLNNPLPPSEACGTSGMKAALNGVPHLSIMDGWWIEGYDGKNGWTFGSDGAERDRDRGDAEALYQVLEKEIIPLYYKVSEDGTPAGWVKVMKESMKSNGPRFSARRMVKEYIGKFYVNALKEA